MSKLIDSLRGLDISNEQMAGSLAVGLTMGLCPFYIPVLPSLLIPLLAHGLGLSASAAFIGLQAATPFFVACLVPFVRLGERIVGFDRLEIDGLGAALREDAFAAFSEFGKALGAGAVAWAMTSPFVIAALYSVFLLLCRALRTKKSSGDVDSKKIS